MLYSLGMLGGPPIAGFGMDLISPNGFFFSIAALLMLYLGFVRLTWPEPEIGVRGNCCAATAFRGGHLHSQDACPALCSARRNTAYPDADPIAAPREHH